MPFGEPDRLNTQCSQNWGMRRRFLARWWELEHNLLLNGTSGTTSSEFWKANGCGADSQPADRLGGKMVVLDGLRERTIPLHEAIMQKESAWQACSFGRRQPSAGWTCRVCLRITPSFDDKLVDLSE